MANILMINLPFAGHTNPTLPLTEALVKQGLICMLKAFGISCLLYIDHKYKFIEILS